MGAENFSEDFEQQADGLMTDAAVQIEGSGRSCYIIKRPLDQLKASVVEVVVL
jgi:hypothetical protein